MTCAKRTCRAMRFWTIQASGYGRPCHRLRSSSMQFCKRRRSSGTSSAESTPGTTVKPRRRTSQSLAASGCVMETSLAQHNTEVFEQVVAQRAYVAQVHLDEFGLGEGSAVHDRGLTDVPLQAHLAGAEAQRARFIRQPSRVK